jgi:uncharacterized protein (TIGR02284 family)
VLRDERQTALNDLEVAAREAADAYADAADWAGDAELARQFRELGRTRQRMADELAEHIRRLGDLPSAPDADRETLTQLWAHLRGAVTGSWRAALLAECEQAEQVLEGHIASAVALELAADTREALQRFARDIASARERLRGIARAE